MSDVTTPDANDDLLQMVASLRALDLGHTTVSAALASAIPAERQAHALYTVARILVAVVQTSSDVNKNEVYDALRESVIGKIFKAEASRACI